MLVAEIALPNFAHKCLIVQYIIWNCKLFNFVDYDVIIRYRGVIGMRGGGIVGCSRVAIHFKKIFILNN